MKLWTVHLLFALLVSPCFSQPDEDALAKMERKGVKHIGVLVVSESMKDNQALAACFDEHALVDVSDKIPPANPLEEVSHPQNATWIMLKQKRGRFVNTGNETLRSLRRMQNVLYAGPVLNGYESILEVLDHRVVAVLPQDRLIGKWRSEFAAHGLDVVEEYDRRDGHFQVELKADEGMGIGMVNLVQELRKEYPEAQFKFKTQTGDFVVLH